MIAAALTVAPTTRKINGLVVIYYCFCSNNSFTGTCMVGVLHKAKAKSFILIF